MLQVVISANVPQNISDASASQGGGGDEASLGSSGPGGFAALLASQIRDAIAQFEPATLEKGVSAKKLGLQVDEKASTDDQGVAVNPLVDLMGIVSVPPVPFSPVVQSASQAAEVTSAEELAVQNVSTVSTDGAVRVTGAAPESPKLVAPEESDESIQPAAEFAVGGKNLPQATLEKAVAAHSEGAGATSRVAGFEDLKPRSQGNGLEQVQGNGLERARADGMVAANPVPVPAQQSPTVVVTPRVGSAEWGPAVSEKVVWMANQKHQVAELHLNPPNLGPVEVRLTIGQDQQASATFVAHHPVVREAIETALPRLREMLAESGIMLGNATVGAESFGQQQQASDQGGGGRGFGRNGDGVQQSADGAVLESGATSRRSLLDGMVDIFA